VALAAHRVEEGIKRSKGEAGLADYEVRTWRGWHHHQALLLIATWFLVLETRRGKKWTPALTVPQIRDGIAMVLRAAYQCHTLNQIARDKTRRLRRNESARF
jgi:SRSO17 transposase